MEKYWFQERGSLYNNTGDLQVICLPSLHGSQGEPLSLKEWSVCRLLHNFKMLIKEIAVKYHTVSFCSIEEFNL